MEGLVKVIDVVAEKCLNCHRCIAVCPVKYCNNASGDYVSINDDLCIGCGACLEACLEAHGGVEEKCARVLVDDTAEFVFGLQRNNLVAPGCACGPKQL